MTDTTHFLWFLPMDTDVSHIGMWPQEGPQPTVDHLVAITKAAEAAGLEGLLVPSVYNNPLDDLTCAGAVLSRTERAYLLLAIRANQYHPAQAAKMLYSLCTLFPARVRLNITSGSSDEDRWTQIPDDREQRGARLLEWLEVFTSVLYGTRPVHYEGRFYYANRTKLRDPLREHLPIALSGSSQAAHTAMARYGDEHLIFAAPLDAVREQVMKIRSIPVRDCEFTITMRVHLIVRESEDEAHSAAAEIISRIDPRVLAAMQADRSEAGSQREYQHSLANADDLYITPNLWTGVGTARYGAASALVGSPGQIADRLAEYRDVGVTGFILSGYPKLEECHRFRQLLTPVLRARGLLARSGEDQARQSAGEIPASH